MTRHATALALLVLIVTPIMAGHGTLSQVTQLQKKAEAANSGALGCGMGSITVHTSTGKVSVASGLDPIHVFGKEIQIDEIHALLKSRADYLETNKATPMSGHVSDLMYVCLLTVSLAKDTASVPYIVPLLGDEDEVVSRWAGHALQAIQPDHPSLRKQNEAEEENDE